MGYVFSGAFPIRLTGSAGVRGPDRQVGDS